MPAIELASLTKDYGDLRANDGLTFEVRSGEVFGYLGPNGAGKTTTIRTLMGFMAPTSGSATVLGADVTDEAALVEAKRHIGYLPANPAFDEHVTGRELLDLHAALKGDDRLERLLDTFAPPLTRPIRELSTGNVQKLGLVQAFMHDPDLVVMDEPTSGLDPLMQREFNEFLRAEQERGTTVFMSSHVLGEVRQVCDRVAVLRAGKLVAIEAIEDLLRRSGKTVRLRAAEPVDARRPPDRGRPRRRGPRRRAGGRGGRVRLRRRRTHRGRGDPDVHRRHQRAARRRGRLRPDRPGGRGGAPRGRLHAVLRGAGRCLSCSATAPATG
ncbi:MAG: ABC transporter ATP-binding protein [Halobacteriales archaeon]|nr:ABC transporter ATP-binding protein [Halobacteriales archaeon]